MSSHHFWFRVICCYMPMKSPYLNLFISGCNAFTWPYPYLPNTSRSFSHTQHPHRNHPLHGKPPLPILMTTAYHLPKQQFSLNTSLPDYHPQWFYLSCVKSHRPTISPTTFHPSSSMITAFPPHMIFIS